MEFSSNSAFRSNFLKAVAAANEQECGCPSAIKPVSAFPIFDLCEKALEDSPNELSLRIFSVCFNSTSGRRIYIICNQSHIFHVVLKLSAPFNSIFEVLTKREFVKPFFDIDCRLNCHDDECAANARYDQFLAAVFAEFNLAGCEKPLSESLLQLDASTSSKYSRHIVINNGTLFESPAEFKTWLRNSRLAPFAGFFDEKVYGAKQNFRLAFCPKFGTANALKFVNSDFQCSSAAAFSLSLVGVLRNGQKFEAPAPKTMAENSREPSNCTAGRALKAPPEQLQYADFLTDLVAELPNWSGIISKVTKLRGDLICVNFNGYKFCEIAGRHHTSNNIIVLADVVSRTYKQQCHNSECKSKRGRWHLLKTKADDQDSR